MNSKYLYLALIFIIFSTDAHSNAVGFTIADELNNKHTHYVNIKSDIYSEYTLENYIQFICKPSGMIDLRWHRGGRHGGWWVKSERLIQFKFDNGEVQQLKLGSLRSDRNIAKFIKNTVTGNQLIMKNEFDEGSYKFPLKGSTKAFVPFHKQCLGKLGEESPKTSSTYPPKATARPKVKKRGGHQTIPYAAPDNCMWLRNSETKYYELDCK